MSTEKGMRFFKRMPPKCRIARRLVGKITCTDLDEEDLWRLWFHKRHGEGMYADLPKKLFIEHGIAEKGQMVEYIFVYTAKKERGIVMRRLKEKKLSRRAIEKIKAEVDKELKGREF